MSSQSVPHTKEVVPFVLSIYILPLLLLMAVAAANLRMGIPVGLFARDPASTAGLHPFAGIMSNVGIMTWISSAAICLFSWAILLHRTSDAKMSKFLLCSGLMTMLLALDDLFMFHEYIFPWPEYITFIAYGCLIIWGISVFKPCIIKSEYLSLIIALVFLGISIFVDALQYRLEPMIGEDCRIFLEDGFKLLGIVGWSGYFLRTSFIEIRKNIEF